MSAAPQAPESARPTLSVRVVDRAGLGAYVPAWEALADNALEPNVFYEPWMLLPALEAFGAGHDLLFVLVFAHHAPKPAGPLLCGLFPLERRRHYKGFPVPALRLWQHVHCYLCTPLVRSGYAGACLEAFFRWLAADRRGAAVLECPRLSGDGPFHQALVEHLAQHQTPALVVEWGTRAVLRPRADAQAYLGEALSAGKRKKLRRAEERLREAGPLEYAALEAPAHLEAWLEEFLRLEAGGWKGRAGTALNCSPAHRDFFLAVCREAFRRGRLMLLALRCGGRPVAALCNFLAGPASFAFKVAFDEAYARFSPGVLLELENVRRMHRQTGFLWQDSCADSGPSLTTQLWLDRRVIQTLLVAPGKGPGPFLVAVLPLLRWCRRAVTALGQFPGGRSRRVEEE
jgi:CelD/BcsL family acetyltransferase involved in cellulose biosynthesis